MVVILLLTPYATNGCDGGSNESSTISTTSTGDTAILTTNYNKIQQHKQQQQLQQQQQQYQLQQQHQQQYQRHNLHYEYPTNFSQHYRQHPQQFSSHKNNNENCRHINEATNTNSSTSTNNNNNIYFNTERLQGTRYAPYPTHANTTTHQPQRADAGTRLPMDYQTTGSIPISFTPKTKPTSPPPPPLPKSKPPYAFYYSTQHNNLCANIIPKPPRSKEWNYQHECTNTKQQQQQQQPHHVSFMDPPHMYTSITLQEDVAQEQMLPSINQSPARVQITSDNHCHQPTTYNSNKPTNNTDFVRHVTRVNFYDIDTLQVEYESKDDNNFDTEAITKEEEWITKRKTELTTTRQIETRVKRNVVLEDGKVVEDSGPIVSTNTTEDTDKQETESTEKRDLGIPVDSLLNTNNVASLTDEVDGQLTEFGKGGTLIKKMTMRPTDGLVREINDKRVISHEEIKDYLETEDVKHLGDFTDETYVKAVNSGSSNLEEVLYSTDSQKQLVPLGPKIIANTSKSFKTIDTEDKQKRSLAQEDGKIITESKTTTEHEIIVDKELPPGDDKSTGSQEQIRTIEATQRFFKQRDEQHVDLVANGKIIDTEMRYAAETMQMEKDGSLERPGDWDSLSDRMRKLRRPHQKTLLQQHKEAALLADRKDALTKRPLDFDREEETRKGETMKWLESHFGSESTVSNEDEDTEIEPTKKTYFNVTIKSNQAQNQNVTTTNGHRPSNVHEKKLYKEQETPVNNTRSKYYQGISNWNERKDKNVSTNHFASKAFRDDLQETVERNRLKKVSAYGSRDKLNDSRYLVQPNDNYVSREDILQQKRQSISSQFLAKSRKSSSRDKLNEEETIPMRTVNGSRTDLHYNKNIPEDNTRSYTRAHNDNMRSQNTVNTAGLRINDFVDERSKIYERELSDSARYDIRTSNYKNNRRSSTPEDMHIRSSTLGRPTVPQRRRAIEKKFRQQTSISPPLKVPLDSHRNLTEPPPDYSPPPRSSSPQIDYVANSLTSNGDTTNGYTIGNTANTLTRKQNQRTRFAPTTPTPSYRATTPQRPAMATQTTQTTPSTLSTSTVASHKSSKVGQVIGNSLRKLVSKIRSASVERKIRMKSKSKSREHSPTTQSTTKHGSGSGATTYQQYNVIDSHIVGQPDSNDSERESLQPDPDHGNKIDYNLYSNSSTMVGRNNQRMYKRADSADPFLSERDQAEQATSPRQRYYLGEDPYSSTLYGKENIYDPNSVAKRNRNARQNVDFNYAERSAREANAHRQNESDRYEQRNITSNTLGRYQKSSQRFAGSTPNLNHDYRSTQTLPRKLHEHQQPTLQQQQQYQKTNQRFLSGNHTLGHPEKRSHNQGTMQNQGPAKPARTYAKALNRSKSFNFNVHGMNGSNDPSPIYIEKLTKNNYSNNLQSSQAYKSNPHLYSGSRDHNPSLLQSGLKSPSIVNLISRSQKDLSNIGINDDERPINYGGSGVGMTLQREDKKQLFLNELQQQAPDLYRTLHGNDDYTVKARTKYKLQSVASVDSLPPVEINKDTASIIRRGSTTNNEYVSTVPYNYSKSNEIAQNKRILMNKDEQRRRSSGPTIIEVRNIDSRK